MDTRNPLSPERFELLSAYLDGEVSPAERQQVEAWLTSDPDVQHTYRQLLALQNNWRSLPSPTPAIAPEELAERVMTRLDRQQPRLWIWGGLGTAAALVVGALSGLLTSNPDGVMQMAEQPLSPPHYPSASSSGSPDHLPRLMATRPQAGADPNALLLALDRPPVAIPVVSSGTNSSDTHLETSF